MTSKKDMYYIIAIISVVGVFGAWVIPQFMYLLLLHTVAPWLIILVVCIVLPVIALTILWLIIQEIQAHFETTEIIEDKEINESFIIDQAFTEKDEKFIEEIMRKQLDQQQYEDKEVFELSKKLILTYVNSRVKMTKVIPLKDISRELEIPQEVVKDIVLLLIAEDLIDGMLEKDAIVSDD